MPRRNRRWRDRGRPQRERTRPQPRPARRPAPWTPSPHDAWLDPREERLPPPARHGEAAELPRLCGACREWLELEGGRGQCLHPGSGFMYPYADTPACGFFTPLR
ncbi:MAG TPA: hypothetical protein VIO14_04865 [Dehalococcoidia bacterium]